MTDLRGLWRKLREGGALMVGVPDYDRYLQHMREKHPELPPLSREAFVRGRMLARYGGKGTGKCPC
ncbi:MAG TPA: CstA-like transporter-associated (seleno)protein [Fluviicoccus sp.]|nr:CstA-like transporter-associated (seleno)protein [Fluviicoccus sp.]